MDAYDLEPLVTYNQPRPSETMDQPERRSHSPDLPQLPSGRWRVPEIRQHLELTQEEYDKLYLDLETAMRLKDMVGVKGLARSTQRTKLYTLFAKVYTRFDADPAKSGLKIKALTQLALRINSNTKRKGERKRYREHAVPTTQATVNSSKPWTKPRSTDPGPDQPIDPIPTPLVPGESRSSPGLHKHPVTGNMTLLGVRDQASTSLCRLTDVVPTGKPTNKICPDDLSFDTWRAILQEDGVLSSRTDDVIWWSMGQYHFQVNNDRSFRAAVNQMLIHKPDMLVFRIKPLQMGKPHR
ncbi:MAG: hypothetical protein Q9225_000462 [Loekoesia sp. 1 TL-2023]